MPVSPDRAAKKINLILLEDYALCQRVLRALERTPKASTMLLYDIHSLLIYWEACVPFCDRTLISGTGRRDRCMIRLRRVLRRWDEFLKRFSAPGENEPWLPAPPVADPGVLDETTPLERELSRLYYWRYIILPKGKRRFRFGFLESWKEYQQCLAEAPQAPSCISDEDGLHEELP